VVRDAELGRRLADKLVQVWRKGGEETWVLVHVEVQGQKELLFAKRMFVYNYRIFDRYNRPVASLALLADQRSNWRPDSFGYELWGCRVGIEFPVVKVADYMGKWEELEADANPFAICVMVHLKAQETKHDVEDRWHWKLILCRRLYDHGYRREDVLNLFRFIDWLMMLPEELEEGFLDEIYQYEEERGMPYVMSAERIGIKKGIQQGIQQGMLEEARDMLLELLDERFGVLSSTIVTQIKAIGQREVLKGLFKQAIRVQSMDQFKELLLKVQE